MLEAGFIQLMPRVTIDEHYRRHRFLRMLWTEPGLDALFALLSSGAQWRLHDFYCPDTHLDLYSFDAQWREVVGTRASHINQAGKDFRVIESAFIEVSRASGADSDQLERAVLRKVERRQALRSSRDLVTISPVVRPIDVECVAKVFLRLAQHESQTHYQEGRNELKNKPIRTRRITMPGYKDGEQWTNSDGTKVTVNSTNDPKAPGGYYVSQQGTDGSHATAVFNSDSTMADTSANNGWESSDTQSQDE